MASNVWPFKEQIDKFGYINNPNWVETPGDHTRHTPCGYWHKGDNIYDDPGDAINSTGFMWVTGRNNQGQLGLGNYTNQDVFTPVPDLLWRSIGSGGEAHELAESEAGLLFVTGSNDYGQLGWNGLYNRTLYTPAPWYPKGGSSNCSAKESMFINTDDRLYGTGYNFYGTLGLGDNLQKTSFQRNNDNIDLWKQLSCGYAHTVAIKKDDGSLWGTGLNANGQLGLGADLDNKNIFTLIDPGEWTQVACGGYATLAIKADGTLWATGKDALGVNQAEVHTLTQETLGKQWKFVEAGLNFAAALDENDTLWTTGKNDEGQLCLRHYDEKLEFQNVSNTYWKQIACGAHHIACRKHDRTIWTGGYNAYGQLSLDHNYKRPYLLWTGTYNEWGQVACGYYTTRVIADSFEKRIPIEFVL